MEQLVEVGIVFERIELPPGSIWSLQAERETWLLALNGDARTGPSNIGKGDAIFAHSERVDVDAGKVGLTGLVAYAAHSPLPNFLQRRTQLDATDAGQPKDVQVPPSLRQATAGARMAAWKEPNEVTQSFAFVGNHLQDARYATFTYDLHRAVAMARPVW